MNMHKVTYRNNNFLYANKDIRTINKCIEIHQNEGNEVFDSYNVMAEDTQSPRL